MKIYTPPSPRFTSEANIHYVGIAVFVIGILSCILNKFLVQLQ